MWESYSHSCEFVSISLQNEETLPSTALATLSIQTCLMCVEDEKFHDLPCHLQAGIIQSQIKSPRIESSRVQGCWEQGAGWKGREGRRMAQLQNGEREPPFLHFVPFGSSKPRWYLSILGRADRFTPSAEPNINLFQKYPHRRTQKSCFTS